MQSRSLPMATPEAGYGPPSNTGTSATDSPATLTASTCSRPLAEALEQPHLAARNNVKSFAGIAFVKQKFPRAQNLSNRLGGQQLHLGLERGWKTAPSSAAPLPDPYASCSLASLAITPPAHDFAPAVMETIVMCSPQVTLVAAVAAALRYLETQGDRPCPPSLKPSVRLP